MSYSHSDHFLNDFRPDAISIDSGSDGSRRKRTTRPYWQILSPGFSQVIKIRDDDDRSSRFAATILPARQDPPGRCVRPFRCEESRSRGFTMMFSTDMLVLSMGLSCPEYSRRRGLGLGLELSSSRIRALPRRASPCEVEVPRDESQR